MWRRLIEEVIACQNVGLCRKIVKENGIPQYTSSAKVESCLIQKHRLGVRGHRDCFAAFASWGRLYRNSNPSMNFNTQLPTAAGYHIRNWQACGSSCVLPHPWQYHRAVRDEGDAGTFVRHFTLVLYWNRGAVLTEDTQDPTMLLSPIEIKEILKWFCVVLVWFHLYFCQSLKCSYQSMVLYKPNQNTRAWSSE